MIYGHKDNFHFRTITKVDEKKVRNIIFSILEDYGLTLDISGVDHDLFDIVEHYKNGLFGVIETIDTKQIVGSFALYPISEKVVELRKMYLLKEYRGQGIGKWVVEFCKASAQKKGFESMTLETASVLKEAIGLYEKLGFVRSNDPNHTERCDVVMNYSLLRENIQ